MRPLTETLGFDEKQTAQRIAYIPFSLIANVHSKSLFKCNLLPTATIGIIWTFYPKLSSSIWKKQIMATQFNIIDYYYH